MAEDKTSPKHPAPQRGRVGWWRQLIGILIAPAAWVAQMALSTMLISRGCSPVNIALIAVSAASFIVGIAGLATAWLSWRRSKNEAANQKPARQETLRQETTDPGKSTLDIGEGRTRFLALISVCANGLFLLAMLFTASAFLLVPECRAALPSADFSPAEVAKGAYLARLSDCTSCHTVPGQPEFSGGYQVHSPFGTIYGSNITPDKAYGIGQYTLADFDRAVRRGVARDGHHLYPAMPYPAFARMDLGDIRALYAYFMKGVKPVHHQPPQTRLPFPLNQRWGLWFWNALFLRTTPYAPQPQHDALWNRGAFLVRGPAHCGSCHTPRNLAYAEKGTNAQSPDFLSGTDIDRWHAANLRGDTVTGLGRWTEADIAGFLKTGHALGPQGHAVEAMGSMAQVVENSGQYMSDDDRMAIAHYLKGLDDSPKPLTISADTPAFSPTANPVFDQPGAGLYAQDCAGCHGAAGEGKAGKFPQLAGNPVVLSRSPTSLIHLVLAGGAPPQTEGHPPPQDKPRAMPAFEGKLNDREIAHVLTYVRSSFGNHAPEVTQGEVRALREQLPATPLP